MTTIFYHQHFLDHLTGTHPESPKRLTSICDSLSSSGWFKSCRQGEVAKATQDQLTVVHTINQITEACDLAAAGGGYLDPDTVMSPASYDVALTAAGTAITAVDTVMSLADGNALCLIRPPGHHATADRSMGFCVFNNIAVAARHAQKKHGANRILIVDWDVHHGNGTQDIFYEDPSVFFYSIHRFPFYPGTGDESELGTGKGRGTTLNVPVQFGVKREQYLDLFQSGLERAVAAARPDLILISAGFDAHADDPVGNLGLNTFDFATMTKSVKEVANTYCNGRIVSCLEGGYNLKALADSVAAHIGVLAAPQP